VTSQLMRCRIYDSGPASVQLLGKENHRGRVEELGQLLYMAESQLTLSRKDLRDDAGGSKYGSNQLRHMAGVEHALHADSHVQRRILVQLAHPGSGEMWERNAAGGPPARVNSIRVFWR
jgi:hypothetical protein